MKVIVLTNAEFELLLEYLDDAHFLYEDEYQDPEEAHKVQSLMDTIMFGNIEDNVPDEIKDYLQGAIRGGFNHA